MTKLRENITAKITSHLRLYWVILFLKKSMINITPKVVIEKVDLALKN